MDMLIGILIDTMGGMLEVRRMLLEFCLEKELSVSNTWCKRVEKRKVTLRMGENEKEIDFALIKKEYRLSM